MATLQYRLHSSTRIRLRHHFKIGTHASHHRNLRCRCNRLRIRFDFSGLGVKVDLIHPGDRLLNFLDDEISDALSYHLRDKGVLIRHNEQFGSLEVNDRYVTMVMASGKK